MSDRPILFFIRNHHGGSPPSWISQASEGRRGYFENAFGEQWVADLTPSEFRLAGGDVDWKTISVQKPDYAQLLRALEASSDSPVGGFNGVILGRAEVQWLRALFLSVVPVLAAMP